MFEWTQESIAYMDDACRRTDFHRRLAAELSAVSPADEPHL